MTNPEHYVVSSSLLTTWKRCRRKWWFTYYRGLALRGWDATSKRETGLRVHRALAAYYVPDGLERVDPRQALEEVIVQDWTRVEAQATERGVDEDQLARLRLDFEKVVTVERAMVEGYLQWVAETGVDADLRVTDSETPLSVDLEVDVDDEQVPVRVVGTLDVRANRISDGRQVFLDHKTTGAFATVLTALPRNEQKLHYLLLLRLTTPAGEPLPDAALWNLLRRVQRTARAKPPFYAREEVPINQHEVESYRRRMLGATRDVVRTTRALDAGADHRDVAYPTPTGACSWDCDFATVCTMADDGTPGFEDALRALYEQVDPHERYDMIQEVE